MTRVVASIEARMGSSRFPGKVLAPLNGRPTLSYLLERLKACEYLDDIVLATSTDPADNELEHWANKENVACFRGSEDDVLQRVVDAHHFMKSEVIVEITGDCTFLDPQITDWGIQLFLENPCDVAVTSSSFPMGINFQVFRLEDLDWVAKNIEDPAVREHVSLYFYENPDKYRILRVPTLKSWTAPHYRITLDYQEDLEFLEALYKELSPQYQNRFGLREMMDLLKEKPQLLEINQHCQQKSAR